MHPSEEPKHQSSQPGSVMWEYNMVGSLSLLVIESRRKFEVWNFLEVCLRSFRFEMSPRHTVLNHLVIYPVVIPVLWFHWPIFLCNWISKSSKKNNKTRITGLLQLKCLFLQYRQFFTAVTCWSRRKVRRMHITWTIDLFFKQVQIFIFLFNPLSRLFWIAVMVFTQCIAVLLDNENLIIIILL